MGHRTRVPPVLALEGRCTCVNVDSEHSLSQSQPWFLWFVLFVFSLKSLPPHHHGHVCLLYPLLTRVLPFPGRSATQLD